MMSWEDWYLSQAIAASKKSKDETKVGAVLIGPEGEVRLTAFNGLPRGVKDLLERFMRPKKYLFASHAEQNLIAFAAREGIRTSGCSVYVTHPPCSSCARSLIQAGIKSVTAMNGTTSMPTEEFTVAEIMFEEACVVFKTVE